MRTQFKTIKAYKKQSDAEERMQKLLKEFPEGVFSIVKRKPVGKHKITYTLRQVVKKGSKTK